MHWPVRGEADPLTFSAGAAPAFARPTGLCAATIGCRVPRHDFDCIVHSVFAHACNLSVADGLLTVVHPRGGDAPTAIVLHDETTPDLRSCFRQGMRLHRRGGHLRGRGITLALAGARLWSPPPWPPRQPPDRIRANVAFARRILSAHRCRASSVFQPESGPHAAALLGCVRALHEPSLERCLRALVGWGEGSTPAGDDYLVGLLAGLELFADDAVHRAFLAALRAHITAQVCRTTDISAHLLRLAAHGHFSAALESLRIGLVCAHRSPFLKRALDRALAIGATSGADTVSGLLVGLAAWLPGAAGGAHT